MNVILGSGIKFIKIPAASAPNNDPAEKKAYPIRWLIVVLSTFSALLFGVTGILIKNRIDQFNNS